MHNYFAENLHFIRKSKKLSQKQAADAINVSVPTISNWENGVSTPNILELITASTFFEISVQDFLFTSLKDRAEKSQEINDHKFWDELDISQLETDKTPHCVVIDCDGVLTDGTLTIDQHGKKLFKKFHTRDVRAIRELVSLGYEVYIVSADDWDGAKHFAEKVGAEFICMKDKGRVFEAVSGRPFIAIGDDSWDIPMFGHADICYCPLDAFEAVKYLPGMNVLDTFSGQGVIADFLLKFKP
jgi:3-deoxy-D-manno-octulosonate 8-phosphate phosphatase KdsC-like HAD superfamily phosphatase/DNA-binding XRE family transcriptional regulator